MTITMNAISRVLLAAVLTQATAPSPIRLGDVARQLSDQDVADIQRIVSDGGPGPWLLNGFPGQIRDLRSIDAYLPPDLITPEIRRGSVRSLVSGSPAALAAVGLGAGGSALGAWLLTTTERYAQVAVAGRRLDQIEGDQDVNQPFRVTGPFDDEALIDLARFVRSSPSGPVRATGVTRGTVHGGWPIVNVVRRADAIEVRLRKEDFAWELVTVRRQGAGWVVTAISMVFAQP